MKVYVGMCHYAYEESYILFVASTKEKAVKMLEQEFLKNFKEEGWEVTNNGEAYDKMGATLDIQEWEVE